MGDVKFISGDNTGLGISIEDVKEKLKKDQEKREFKDAGAYIGGSKKEKAAWRHLLQESDLVALEKDAATATEMVIKDNVYPRIDPKEEQAKGVSSGCAYLKSEFRKAFPPQPAKNTPEYRKAYIRFAKYIVGKADKAKTVDDIKKSLGTVYNAWSGYDVIKNIITESDLIDMVSDYEHTLVKKGLKLPPGNNIDIGWIEKNKKVIDEAGLFSKSWVEYEVAKYYGKRLSNVLLNRTENAHRKWIKAGIYEGVSREAEAKNIERLKERYKTQSADIALNVLEARQMPQEELFEIIKQNIESGLLEMSLLEIGKSDIEEYRKQVIRNYYNQLNDIKVLLENVKDHLPDDEKYRSEDWSWAFGKKKGSAGKKTDIEINTGKPLSFIKRTGGLLITDEMVKEKNIIEMFGFAGVQLGKSIPDKEVREHIRHFLGAMADLFEILNYNAVQVNQMGNLSIAFGARGQGSASAHYESLRKVINITRSNGDGSVAHEWTHYLDNVLSQYGRDKKPMLSASISKSRRKYYSLSHSFASNAPSGIKTALLDLFSYIYSGARKSNDERNTIEREFFASKARPYDLNTGKTVDRSLEFLQRTYPAYFYYPDAPNNQASVFGRIAQLHNLDKVTVKLKVRGATEWFVHSKNMGSPYWIKNWEMLARGFETYIYDKLEKAGRTNNYLVSGGYFDHGSGVYPSGQERKDLFDLYDRLMSAIKEELRIKDFEPFTDKRSDEFIDLEDSKPEKTGKTNEKVKTGIVVAYSARQKSSRKYKNRRSATKVKGRKPKKPSIDKLKLLKMQAQAMELLQNQIDIDMKLKKKEQKAA